MRPNLSRHAWSAAAAGIALAVCLGCGSATPSPAPAAVTPTTQPPLATSAPTVAPTVAATPTPAPTRTATPTPAPSPPPSASRFWAAVQEGLRSAGTLELGVDRGRVAYIVEYTVTASASVVGGQRIFVCLDGHAYDGQSSWVQAPGTYGCGAAALQDGFVKSGQPVDSWGPGSGVDQSIQASVAVVAGGRWRWTYRSVSPLSGDVRSELILDPRTMHLLSGTRTDAQGSSTYTFHYGVALQPIVVPTH